MSSGDLSENRSGEGLGEKDCCSNCSLNRSQAEVFTIETAVLENAIPPCLASNPTAKRSVSKSSIIIEGNNHTRKAYIKSTAKRGRKACGLSSLASVGSRVVQVAPCFLGCAPQMTFVRQRQINTKSDLANRFGRQT